MMPSALQRANGDGAALDLKGRGGEPEDLAHTRASPGKSEHEETFICREDSSRAQHAPAFRTVEILSGTCLRIEAGAPRIVQFHCGLPWRRLQPSCSFCFSRSLRPANEAIFTFRFSDAKAFSAKMLRFYRAKGGAATV